MRDRNGVDTGFTTVMSAPKAVCSDSQPPCDDPAFPYNPGNLPYYIPGNLLVNTAAGTLTITTTDGDNVLGLDDQDNALAAPFDASKPFLLHARILAPTSSADVPDADFEGGGLFWGIDASNYVKLVLAHNCDNLAGPCYGIQLGAEVAGSWDGGDKQLNPLLAAPFKTLDLYLAGDPGNASKTVTASYSLDDGQTIEIETRALSAALFSQSAVCGIVATNTPYTPPDGGSSFEITFSRLRLSRP